MKFPNLKKYFFAHITVVLFYLTLIFFICAGWLNKHYPSETYTIYGEPGVFT